MHGTPNWSTIELDSSWNREDDEYTVPITKTINEKPREEKCTQDNGTKDSEYLIAVTFPGFEEVATRLQSIGP